MNKNYRYQESNSPYYLPTNSKYYLDNIISSNNTYGGYSNIEPIKNMVISSIDIIMMENNCINNDLLKTIIEQIKNSLVSENNPSYRSGGIGTAVYFYHKIIRQYHDSCKAKVRNHREKINKN